MLYYFDSSAAVKRYAPEKGNEWVKLYYPQHRFTRGRIVAPHLRLCG